MSFDNPAFLYLFFLFLVLIPAVIIRYRKSRERAALFAAAAPSGRRKALLKELRLRMIISDVFFLLFTGFLFFALAGPRWGIRIVPDFRRGVDLVLAFDLSGSMNVRDCPPFPGNQNDREIDSRLERGLGIAREFTAALADVRLGAAIGKSRGVLAVPLTYDYEAIFGFLNNLDNQAISGRGTNLESIIDAALTAFQDSVPSRRVIILFSDGESLSGSFQAAVERARRAGISVSSVALGSDPGAKVPVDISPEAPDGFLLADGREVISARQANLLRSGAERSRGFYVDGNRNDSVQTLVDNINSLSAESRISGYRREENPRWQLFVLFAMFCFFVFRFMGFSRLRKTIPGKKFLFSLLCLLLFSSCTKVQGKLLIMEGNFFNARGYYTEAISSYLKALSYEDAAPYAEYGLGSAYFSLEESSAAMERYEAAEKSLEDLNPEEHQELLYRINYNRGIIFFEREEYNEAANAFREALIIDGSRIEAKQNFELSLLSLSRRNSPQAHSPDLFNLGEETGNSQESRDMISAIIFEFLREKEQEQWISREWDGGNDILEPDY